MKNPLTNKLFCLWSCLLLACLFSGCAARKDSAILVSAPEQDAAEPAVASAPDGSIYVVWVEHLPEKRADVFIRHFDAEQKPLSDAVRVNPEAGAATAWRGDPPTVKVGAGGTVYVGWTARVPVADGVANDLYLSVSRDGGKTFDAPVKVNDDKIPASHGMHSLEIDKNGRVFFAWLDERYLKSAAQTQPMPAKMSEENSGEMKHNHAEPNSEVYFAVSGDDGKTFSANKKIAADVCPCCKTSMASAPDGRLYVAWRQVLDGDFRHIAVSSSVDGGSNFAPFSVVSDDRWQISACPVSGAALSVDSENNLDVVWFTAGQTGTPGIYETESRDGGKTFASRVFISGDATGGTPVILKSEKGNSRIVFAAADKNARFFSAANGSNDFAEGNLIANAELPGAALSKDKMFVAFVRNENEKRKVFLTKQD